MSNYPPGVTGNEYEIAGADYELEEDFECTNTEYEYIRMSPNSKQYFNEFRLNYFKLKHEEKFIMTMDKFISVMSIYFSEASEIIEEPCGYEGLVNKEIYRGEVFWECPKCGKDYRHDVDGYYDDCE